MNWFLPRMLVAALMAALGAIGGTAIGWGGDTVLVLTVLGAAVGASASAFADRVKGYRLMQWVRGDRSSAAPRDTSFWGELGYRIERALLLSERETEAERAHTRDFLSAIEASPNGVLLLDKQDQIEWCNSVAADHFGLDPIRDVQQRITNLVRDPGFVAYVQQSDHEAGVVVPARSGRGTLSVVFRDYGDGKKLVLSQDITERERTEAMRRDFVANVSHEIRTPLTVLSGFVETMSSLPLSPEERARVLTLMEQQTQRMQALVTDLLTLAQLEGSPRPAPDQWNSLPGIFDRLKAEVLPLSGGRHSFSWDEVGGWELAGQGVELQSALGNLLTNAVRYTPSGGKISVHWQLRADGTGCLTVTDTGPGIAREHIPRLTERFYRVDGSRSRETGGTGLGLSIVKHVMQRHGGEIDIESEIGKGSSFRLILPAVRVRGPFGGQVGMGSQWAAASTSRIEFDPVIDRHQLAGRGAAPLGSHQAPSGQGS
ncbi:MAG: phosphate regulon sensor histidine kinase PhoR [Rubrivivax sp.]|nr:phosphate regulon sensor histidine kinase PhoR [Rubrivivax sp.]